MIVAVNTWFWDRPATGSGQYVRHLLPALTDLAPPLTVCSVAPRSGAKRGPLANIAKVWFEQVTFPQACARHPVDVAHVPYFASPARPTTPTVVTVHDLIPMVLPAYRGSVLVRTYTRLVAAGARRADAIIADSACSKRDIVAHLEVKPERVHVIPLAAGPQFRPASHKAIKRVRSRYGLPDRYVLYLGGFDRRKNVPSLLKAFAQLQEQEHLPAGLRLVIAGRLPSADTDFAPDPQRVAAEVDITDTVVFSGWVDEADKPAVYSGADLLVFPSTYEGFGLPVLEAMACGTPVVTSSVSSLPEVVGDAGLTVAPDDADGLAQAMAAVLRDEDRRHAMREAGLERAAGFSWQRTARTTLKVYKHTALQ
ncbi:MAG: D-inositol 3-phosphate glycosyltransferase [Anaerolineales bacterium]|nr:D-inositol 3-phosphate glycosyltransferase [Anaerolineales bacterium]